MITYVVYPNVHLGTGVEIGDFVIIGIAPRNMAPRQLETYIGSNALIRSHSVIYGGNRIGSNFHTGHGVMIRELNEIGDDVSIGSHSIIEHNVKIGNRVRIHSSAFIPEYSILEDGAWVGPQVAFTNARYPLSRDAKERLRGPRVLRDAKIGANATLLPGVVIGCNALVGAGAVVVHDVPDGKVVVGNPARVVGNVSDLSAYETSKIMLQG